MNKPPGPPTLPTTSPPPPMPTPRPKKPVWKRWWFIGAAIFIVIGIIGSLAAPKDEEPPQAQDTPTETASSLPTPTQTPTVAPAASTPPAPPPPPPAPSFVTFEGDGTYAVPRGSGAWARTGHARDHQAAIGRGSRTSRATLRASRPNDNNEFPAVVTITKQDKGFQTQDCGEWTTDLSAITTSRTEFDDGDFINKTDMKPGTYKSSGGEGCYWARVRDFKHGLDSIIANGNTDNPTIVTIKSTDAGFVSRNCGHWKRVG